MSEYAFLHNDIVRYLDPLLVLSGREYTSLSFEDLHRRICDALRGDRPRLVAESGGPDGRVRLHFEGGSVRETRIESAGQIQRGSHDA